jgi:hypothetical protein
MTGKFFFRGMKKNLREAHLILHRIVWIQLIISKLQHFHVAKFAFHVAKSSLHVAKLTFHVPKSTLHVPKSKFHVAKLSSHVA